MKTKPLYYEDCHMDRCAAVVQSCIPQGTHWEITLDQTVFYPEGGGQPCDLGSLGSARVLDVQERAGQVIHLCDQPLEEGATVEAVIDYPRRFGFMQQHTADHLLSGLIFQRFGFHNVGFHMGADGVTIDFDGEIPPQTLLELELEVNQLIWKNLPVSGWYPMPQELAQLSYRSKKALDWPVRVVRIPGIDLCACCGVHVANTGEIGVIKIISCVRFHQGCRILMLAGREAYVYLNAVFQQNRSVSQAFSAKPLETGAAAERMCQTLEAERYRNTGLERRLFHCIAKGYSGQKNVLHFEPELSGDGLRQLADSIATEISGTAAVFSQSDSHYGYALVSRSEDLRELCRAANQALCGRGGGKPGFQQGRVAAEQKQIQAFFETQWGELSE